MSLTGSRFSSESAPRPFHYGVSRMRWSNLCSGLAVRRNGRSKRTCELTSSIVPRGTSSHRSVESEFPSIGFDPVEFSCCCRGLSPGPTDLGAVHPDAVHDHSNRRAKRHDRLFHPATPGNLHRPGLKPRPFLRIQHALSRFVEHDPHHLVAAA